MPYIICTPLIDSVHQLHPPFSGVSVTLELEQPLLFVANDGGKETTCFLGCVNTSCGATTTGLSARAEAVAFGLFFVRWVPRDLCL